MLNSIKRFFKFIYHIPLHNSLLVNATRGFPNSQLELAKFYLIEKKDYIEAYAWAEVAVIRNLRDAASIKQLAEEQLKPYQLKEAWDKARQYKNCFI